LLGNLQILRVFAASGVVLYHCNAEFFGNHTEFAGVALFFALSGFLMCKIKDKRAASGFIVERFWRIVPSYWLATAIVVLLFQRDASLGHIFLTLFFVPHQSLHGLFPILGVGWTLNMEVYFYAIFALSILISRRFSPLLAASIVGFVMLALPAVGVSGAFVFYYTHPYIWFFLCGIGVWYVSEIFTRRDRVLSLPKWVFPAALAGYVAIVGVLLKGVDAPLIAVLVISAMLLIAVLTARLGGDWKWRPLIVLGDASYACYLLHTIIIELFRHMRVAIDGSLLTTALIFSVSWLTAIAWHSSVEMVVSKVRSSRFWWSRDQASRA
jgi:exopolysaccharide production protein ExoZ